MLKKSHFFVASFELIDKHKDIIGGELPLACSEPFESSGRAMQLLVDFDHSVSEDRNKVQFC